MSKAVLISIQPKWCELIASGKKTVEVRKTKPKMEVPFKVYIYCTRYKKGKLIWKKGNKFLGYKLTDVSGRVIGEFVCDGYDEFIPTEKGIRSRRFLALYESCLSIAEMRTYLSGKTGYGWHISNLIIYDKPKELSGFYKYTEYDDSNNDIRPCNVCERNKFDSAEMCEYCGIDYYGEHCIHLQMKRPPQSWCYVEEV